MKLEAQYVAIRHFEESDAVPLFDHYLGDEKACLYLNRQAHLSSTQTLQAINRWRSQYELAHPNIFVLAIEEIASQVPIGCLVLIPEKSSSEIHFGISRNYQGKGYATQACMLGIEYLKVSESRKFIQLLISIIKPVFACSKNVGLRNKAC